MTKMDIVIGICLFVLVIVITSKINNLDDAIELQSAQIQAIENSLE